MCERYTSEALSGDVVVQFADSKLFAYDFIFQKQDHTLGNLITTWLDANLVGNGEITYAGYDIPHPLRDEMILRVGVADAKESTARAAVATAARGCRALFQQMRGAWDAATGNALPSSSGKRPRPKVPTQAQQVTVQKIG
jgi:DNA-directed RNA polymerase subunit L